MNYVILDKSPNLCFRFKIFQPGFFLRISFDVAIRLEDPLHIGSKRSTLGNHMGQCEVLLGTHGNDTNPKHPTCPRPTLPKRKKTLGLLVPFLIGQKFFSHGYIGYSLYIYIYIFSSPILARLMPRACLWEHSFIFLSSTRPLHPFSLYIWGVHLY